MNTLLNNLFLIKAIAKWKLSRVDEESKEKRHIQDEVPGRNNAEKLAGDKRSSPVIRNKRLSARKNKELPPAIEK